VKKNKSPEKTTPSPMVYKNLESWKSTTAKIFGTIKVKENRTTFMLETISKANDTPAGANYNPASPVSKFQNPHTILGDS
jgi:hypothetical protein